MQTDKSDLLRVERDTMKLYTVDAMRELEQKAIADYGIDSLLLMENAALGFCNALEARAGDVCRKRIGVFCGKGNNGGDGFAIARHLANRGADVTVVVEAVTAPNTKEAAKNFNIVKQMQIPVLTVDELGGAAFDIAVDALFGIGFHGEPEGAAAEMISHINRTAFVAAVDVPSGVMADSGKVSACAVRAHLTVTFGVVKLGQLLFPAKAHVGRLVTADISLPSHLTKQTKTPYESLDNGLCALLPKRDENSHKGSFGKVLVLGGSPGLGGACTMAAEGVLRSGAGMVTVAAPKTVLDTVACFFREMMTVPLPTEGEGLSKTADDRVLEKLKGQDVLLAGCGLGTADSTKKAFLAVVSACDKPMVIDADGINLLKGNINIVKNKKSPVVLTPHPLEFSRISGHSMDYIRENRVAAALDFAKTYQLVLVLKDADTLVATPEGKLFVCDGANSGMATAGSGDVLSGVIAAMLAQGANAVDAARLGVFIHNRAGALARAEKGAYGMTAGDILAAVPYAIRQLAGK